MVGADNCCGHSTAHGWDLARDITEGGLNSRLNINNVVHGHRCVGAIVGNTGEMNLHILKRNSSRGTFGACGNARPIGGSKGTGHTEREADRSCLAERHGSVAAHSRVKADGWFD